MPETPYEMNEERDFMDAKIGAPAKRNMRSWWIKTILLLSLVALSIVMMFTLGDYLTGEDVPQLTLSQLLKRISYPRLLLLLGVILLYILVESSKYGYLLKVFTGKFRFKTSLKTMFLGKYYDGITPFSTGGQPFQIYYLHKKQDIPRGAATAIPIIKYLVSIFILTTLSVVLLTVTPYYLETNTINLTMLIIGWISLGINVMLPITVILFSIFPKTCKRLLAVLVKILYKFHLVKHRYTVTKKYVRELSEYSAALKRFGKEIYKFIPLLLLCVLESLMFVTIPFFVVIAIANVAPTMELAIQIACLIIITRYTALLIPTPGNTGATEATSSLVFATVVGIGSVIGWVILVWRFLTYYVYLLTGMGINIFEIIRSAVRNKRIERPL